MPLLFPTDIQKIILNEVVNLIKAANLVGDVLNIGNNVYDLGTADTSNIQLPAVILITEGHKEKYTGGTTEQQDWWFPVGVQFLISESFRGFSNASRPVDQDVYKLRYVVANIFQDQPMRDKIENVIWCKADPENIINRKYLELGHIAGSMLLEFFVRTYRRSQDGGPYIYPSELSNC